MPPTTRQAPIAPAHDPARVHALEVALSRYASPEGWEEHSLREVIHEAEMIYQFIVEGTLPLKVVKR